MDNTIKPDDFKSQINPKRVSKPKKAKAISIASPVKDTTELPLRTRLKNFIFGTILTKKSPTENILGYIFRQFLLVDSKGVPSVTNTMTWLSIVMTYFWFQFETKLAFSKIITKTEDGMVEQYKGYNEYVYAILVLIISAVLTMYHRRGKGRALAANGESSTPGIIDAAKQFITSKFGSK